MLFLTLRPSPLPHTLYLSLIPIHKWLSRIVVLQSLLHTVLFIALFVKRHTVKKIWKTANLYGIVAMLAFMAIFVTSLPTVRRACYNIFFINHYIFTWVAVITLYFHVRPGIPYLTALNCFLLVLQMGYRFWITKSTTIEATQVSSNMVIVSIPNEAIVHKSRLPGCHIRMIEFDERNYFKQLWKNVMVPIQHPFTVATLPIDPIQKLIVRKGNFKLNSNQKYLITGLFLPHLHFMNPLNSPNPNPKSLLFNTKVKKCLIVVGGSAISFALPILRTLSYNGAMVKIIWVIRDHEDLKVLDDFKNMLVNDDCIDIFITGGYSDDEKFNFKTALEELHRRKRILELTDAERILGDDYDYKKFSTPSPTTVSGDKSPLSQNSVGDYGAVYEDENEIDMNVHFDPGLELGIPRLNMNSSHEHSYISLKHHHSGNTYSFAAERKFENVDLELGERHCKECVETPKKFAYASNEGMYHVDSVKSANSNNIDLYSPGIPLEDTTPLLPLSPKQTQNLNQYDGKSKSAYSSNIGSPGVGFSGTYETAQAPMTSTSNFSFHIRADSSANSYLYDDLADYWVLSGLSCRIEFGRPKLGLYYYNWCIGSSCIGPLVELNTGKSVCCNEITKKGRANPNANAEEGAHNGNGSGGFPRYKKSNGKLLGEEPDDELFLNDEFIKNRQSRFRDRGGKLDDDIWVIGAGPIGLVNKVQLWSNDCGFNFHAESFSV
ncbi:unnamed protein product [Ambrosiozyma monospora]|uniref:Unnamed protein product n=1 Tax=Ambrosiozyma monospora TaxID=43982 RepID=A0A9W7DGZ4_AMBMO|nr:unnamed protein product [Ambrosiozyma monospora]